GKDNPLRCYKEEPTLVSYFQRVKELLVFFYRVAYREGGNLTVRAEPDAATVSPTSERQEHAQLPQDIIRPTNDQRSAMQHILDKLSELKTIDAWSHRSTGGDRQAVAADKEKEMVEELKPAVRDFFMQLICHEFEGQPFQSPVLSFYAMLSRKKAHAGHRSKECARPSRTGLGTMSGTTRSSSSGSTRTAGRRQAITIATYRMSEGAIASNQAHWSSDGRQITYLGTTLSITEHIPQLILAQYQQACELLFDTLLFGENSLGPMQPRKLDDDLDDKAFNSLWLTHPKNAELLSGADSALMKCIAQRPDLKTHFYQYAAKEDKTKLNKRAVDVYEASMQEFLQALATLLHISPMLTMAPCASSGIAAARY
ncbi:hypothetical protein E4U61_007912, partial [Claviceps capensis]